MKLTIKSAESIKLPKGKTDHIEFDDDIAGFGLRIPRGRFADMDLSVSHRLQAAPLCARLG